MKNYTLLLILLCVVVCGCSDQSADALTQKHEEITERSILADFVTSISEDKYDVAFALLHPKLSEEWTIERFTQDWGEIKTQLPSGWKPEATESLSQGPYEQATYGLESNWQSTASLSMVSAKVDGAIKIVQVHIRMPESGDTPDAVTAQANTFVTAMLKEDYSAVQNIFSESCKQQYTPTILKRVKPLLGHSPESTIRTHYRLCANTVWYNVILLNQPDDPATHLELIMQSNSLKTEIASLTFKGRM